jgi:hypothetical protein
MPASGTRVAACATLTRSGATGKAPIAAELRTLETTGTDTRWTREHFAAQVILAEIERGAAIEPIATHWTGALGTDRIGAQFEACRHRGRDIGQLRSRFDHCTAGGLAFQSINEFINRHRFPSSRANVSKQPAPKPVA